MRVLLSDQVRGNHIECNAQDMADGYEFVKQLEEFSIIVGQGYTTTVTDIPAQES